MAIFTAWGSHGVPNALIPGAEPPRVWIEEDPPELVWTIEADTWEEACAEYHRLQGWEPYVPMGPSPR